MATFDQAWAEAAASAPNDTVLIDTLEVAHAAFSAPLRVCNSFEPLAADGLTFQPFYFDLELPTVEAGTLPQLLVKINNLNKALREELRKAAKASTPATVQYRQYRQVAGVNVLGEYMQIPLPVSSISIPTGGEFITLTCEPTNIVNLPLHRAYYTLERFPGLRS
ncbi:DUF1833 family protein [Thiolinea disciformis]|uniref:DUF1833 family protein n=1 Tax=Thiolinea disciformis TaxID=125614 RepID=UPI0003701879|nr:DUF1833 family protein [Thiolinea disciformis]